MTVQGVEYRAFYQIEGDEGTETLDLKDVGFLLGLHEDGEEIFVHGEEEWDEKEQQEILGALDRAKSTVYPVVWDEEEEKFYIEDQADYWPIDSIVFRAGWFLVSLDGPYEDYDEAVSHWPEDDEEEEWEEEESEEEGPEEEGSEEPVESADVDDHDEDDESEEQSKK